MRISDLLSALTFLSVAMAGKIDDFKLPDLENRCVTFTELRGERQSVIRFFCK